MNLALLLSAVQERNGRRPRKERATVSSNPLRRRLGRHSKREPHQEASLSTMRRRVGTIAVNHKTIAAAFSFAKPS